MTQLNLIEHILEHTKYNSSDISKKTGVSSARVSQWKSGKSIPFETREILIKMAGLFGDNPEWAILTKTKKNATGWIKFMNKMSECAEYEDLQDHIPEVYIANFLIMIAKLGVDLPEKAPSTEHLFEEDYTFTEFESLAYDYLTCYGPYISWFERYFDWGNDNNPNEMFDLYSEIESLAQYWALTWVEEDTAKSAGINLDKFGQFEKEIKVKLKKALWKLCNAMNKAGINYETDYYDLLNHDPNWLEDEAEFFDNPGDKNNAVDVLPFGQRVIWERITNLKMLIEELHIKVDTLLSPKGKKFLEKELEHTKPSAFISKKRDK